MTDNPPIISLRQFREKAAEIRQEVQIAVRDRDGNLNILGRYIPYMTYPPGAVELPVAPLDLPVEDEPHPRIIRTPEEAAAAAPAVRPFPKSAQTGRRRKS